MQKKKRKEHLIFSFGCWYNLWLYRVGELTHMRSMCVGVAETGVEHRSPARYLRKLFFIVLLCDQKYQKSARRTRAVLLPNHWRRARVCRASHAWQVRTANGKAKAGDFAAPTVSAIPRERTYHTKKSSRFVHALPARPHINVWRAWVKQVRWRKQGFLPAFSSGRRWRAKRDG